MSKDPNRPVVPAHYVDALVHQLIAAIGVAVFAHSAAVGTHDEEKCQVCRTTNAAIEAAEKHGF